MTHMKITPIAFLAASIVAVQIVARADVNGTITLSTNTALNLDTAATATSGGDILWNGSTITPQGKARAYNLGNLEQAGFNTLSKGVIDGVKAVASSAAIPATKLVAGDVFVVYT